MTQSTHALVRLCALLLTSKCSHQRDNLHTLKSQRSADEEAPRHNRQVWCVTNAVKLGEKAAHCWMARASFLPAARCECVILKISNYAIKLHAHTLTQLERERLIHHSDTIYNIVYVCA